MAESTFPLRRFGRGLKSRFAMLAAWAIISASVITASIDSLVATGIAVSGKSLAAAGTADVATLNEDQVSDEASVSASGRESAGGDGALGNDHARAEAEYFDAMREDDFFDDDFPCGVEEDSGGGEGAAGREDGSGGGNGAAGCEPDLVGEEGEAGGAGSERTTLRSAKFGAGPDAGTIASLALRSKWRMVLLPSPALPARRLGLIRRLSSSVSGRRRRIICVPSCCCVARAPELAGVSALLFSVFAASDMVGAGAGLGKRRREGKGRGGASEASVDGSRQEEGGGKEEEGFDVGSEVLD